MGLPFCPKRPHACTVLGARVLIPQGEGGHSSLPPPPFGPRVAGSGTPWEPKEEIWRFALEKTKVLVYVLIYFSKKCENAIFGPFQGTHEKLGHFCAGIFFCMGV